MVLAELRNVISRFYPILSEHLESLFWSSTLMGIALYSNENLILRSIIFTLILAFFYEWHTSHREHNRLMHALHGNGIMSKLYTANLPVLTRKATAIDDYILWRLDLKAWSDQSVITNLIFGPLPDDTSDEDRNEALKYLCAAIEDKNISAKVAKAGLDDGAPGGLEWLDKQFMQGTAEQPALSRILDNIALKPKESLIAFKARFEKIADAMDPRHGDSILCTLFSRADRR